MRLVLSILFVSLVYTGFCQNPIKVNQFGYRPNDNKVAVLSDPQFGFNASESYTPGSTLELKRKIDNVVVYSSAPVVWNNGNIHDQSGDKVWWFDFSTITDEGEYYIYDPSTAISSYSFLISNTAYNDVLKQVMRAFYYQRSGVVKPAPYAESGWSDIESFQGSDQDCQQ